MVPDCIIRLTGLYDVDIKYQLKGPLQLVNRLIFVKKNPEFQLLTVDRKMGTI